MDDSDDDLCYYGTPLEELDEDNVRQAKAPRIEDQVVCDQQGRRRFHGAFTGGFSAGYFNSVGTKEGWAPSTFVSSRVQRAEAKNSRPQDFMDDEDLASHGIAPEGIQATSSFDDSEQRKRKRVVDPYGPIPGIPVLEEILRPNKETMGMKLLRKLGWKPGQGIGPRVKLTQKKLALEETKRIYGCQLPQDMTGKSDDEEMDEEDCNPDVTFAPDDVVTTYLTNPKSNQFGLGYKPLDRTPVLGGHINLFDPSPLSMKEKKKKLLIKGQAFGVGAFEDEDEDIYATDDMSNYDFGEEKTGDKIKQQQAQSHMSLMGLEDMLDGFSLCSSRQHNPKIYPKPTLPKDFVPQHKSRRRRFELKDSEKQGLGRHELSAEQRGRIIGETSQTTVEIRSGVKGHSWDTPKKSKTKTEDNSEVDQLFEEFKNSGGSLRSDFKPFAKNDEKQRRYELFLKMKDRGQKDRYYLAQPKTMTEWEKARELQEFDRAAKLFQPLTSVMASRFISAVVEEKGPVLKDGLNEEIPKLPEESSISGTDAFGHDVADDRVKAARMSMFGKLTQTVVDWHPDRLLCRRFNVPSPYPDSNFVGVRKTKRDKFSLFSFMEAPSESAWNRQNKSSQPPPDSPKREESTEKSLSDENLEETPETYGLKVPVDGPPTMDLFKAIFQDSDTDSESEEENSEDKEKEKENPPLASSSLKNEEVISKDNGRSKASSSLKNEEVLSRDNGKSPVSSEDDQISIKNSLDNFLSDMRRGKISNTEPLSGRTQEKKRVSRFEPEREESRSIIENIPKPVFMPRKNTQPSSEVPAKGIFANIDFDMLNSYRNSVPSEKSSENPNKSFEIKTQNDEKGDDNQKHSSDSSVDSEDEYGPAIPVHLKNRQQVIRSTPYSVSKLKTSQDSSSEKESRWVVKKDKKNHKKHRHEDKHKRRKEKKKKKHKEQKHKRKSSKKHRRKTSSSSSDSSDN
ncbi:G patch domain-containing protein 1-like [Palaemon carinicauda]|uniref:G patch domain-containing protein 1-like n=1 Tax=Palaemon carinicauda TaxID=392227 RepID=UPI0035B5A1E2